jgi:DNA-nicking Smr family endonuclease
VGREKDRDGPSESFADAVGDVRRIEDRDRLHPPPEPERRAPPRQAPDRRLLVERSDAAVEVRAEDVPRATLADLRAGRIPPERELDLHGRSLAAARHALDEALESALRDEIRCLLVIHGRGQRSADGPVLKGAVEGWLQAPPRAAHLQAFATAPRRLGGAGASLVLLRRRRV